MILSRRAYAAHRKAHGLVGGTINAVKTAIDDGRLVKSLTPDGRIADAAAADAEWAASTLVDRIPQSGPAASSSGSPSRLQELRERREAVQVEMAELELAERRGQLIEIEQARRDVIDKFATVRTRILGVPTRVAQRLPKLAAEVVPVVDELLREVLEDLADGDVD